MTTPRQRRRSVLSPGKHARRSPGRTVRSTSHRVNGVRILSVRKPWAWANRFQGQEVAVVIYSMATSRPEDAPRGMEFLYDLNRLNVATSRARCACILVASPRLLEPDCKTPRQMRLANAMCAYVEIAKQPAQPELAFSYALEVR
ncbi:MAG TPA: AAA domain-containing protein, partial [Thermoanaerobaculia bacterium]